MAQVMNVGAASGKNNALTNLARQAAAQGLSYRQYVQLVADSMGGTMNREARAVLATTGDDGIVNPAFANQSQSGGQYNAGNSVQGYDASKGQVMVDGYGYGPQGVGAVNSEFLAAYNAAGGGKGGGGGNTISAADAAAAQRRAEAGRIRNDIRGRGGELNAIYDQLFGDLDTLLRTRSSDVERDYGDQLSKATEQYSSALPTIQNSYAAIGAADSTDTADAKDAAKKGFDDTTTTIGKNKQKDLAAIGQYGNEQRAKIQSDRDSLNRELGRLDETDDVDALRATRSNVETNLGAAGVTKQTLGTEGKAAKDLSALTQDAGRFEAASNALDNILKSSMSGAVKEAAVKAIVDNAGLSDDEKEKVQLQYGNVYQEQNAA